jgi:hypothetical protein
LLLSAGGARYLVRRLAFTDQQVVNQLLNQKIAAIDVKISVMGAPSAGSPLPPGSCHQHCHVGQH